MLRVALPMLVVAAVAAGTSACGDLSQEDLLFKAGVPSKQQLELQPAGAPSEADAAPGTATQALDAVCGDGDLFCNTRNIAKGLNGLTFGVLDLVDAVVNQPPSTRAKGKRVWGPFFQIAKNQTARFEMTRNPLTGGFDFCLHAAKGRVTQQQSKDITCAVDVDDATGLAIILSGSFTPGDVKGAAARTGRGELTLRTDRIPDFKDFHAHAIVIDFDNVDDGDGVARSIQLAIDGVIVNGVAKPNPITYSFNRNVDGGGNLHFDLVGDLAPRVDGDEELQIDAAWNADQSGRAIGELDAGGQQFREDQCWDGGGAQVYVLAHGPASLDNPSGTTTAGDKELCTVTCEQVVPDATGVCPVT